MKYFIYTLIVVAITIIIFNATKLEFKNLLKGNSFIALTSILTALCVILLLVIFMKSKEVEGKKLK